VTRYRPREGRGELRYNARAKLEFEEQYHGPRGGEDEYTLIVYRGGQRVAVADYRVLGDELYFDDIETRPGYPQPQKLHSEVVFEAGRRHPEAEHLHVGSLLGRSTYVSNAPQAATLRLLDARRRVIEELPLDTTQADFGNPVAREMIFQRIIYQADQGAAAVEFVVDDEVIDMLVFKDYDLRRRDGQEQFAETFFGSLDDVAPPPESGPRRPYRPNPRRRYRRHYR
jgi:hypothetical protein